MSALTDEAVESACQVMHDAYERAAVVHAWETNPASRHQDWADVPESNKATMRDAVRALLGWLGALETTPLAAEPAPEWTDEERGFVEMALAAADAGNAGHWPTVAAYLAAEVRRLRALVADGNTEGAQP